MYIGFQIIEVLQHFIKYYRERARGDGHGGSPYGLEIFIRITIFLEKLKKKS